MLKKIIIITTLILLVLIFSISVISSSEKRELSVDLVGYEDTESELSVSLDRETTTTTSSSTFTGLTDTPANYAGDGGDCVKVKAAEDGLEFVACAGGGDFSFSDFQDSFDKNWTALDYDKWMYNQTTATFNIYNSTWDNRGLINAINPSLWQTNGTVIYNNTADRVGIGTDNPSHELNVVGDVNITENLYIGGNTIFKGEYTLHEVASSNSNENSTWNVFGIGVAGFDYYFHNYVVSPGTEPYWAWTGNTGNINSPGTKIMKLYAGGNLELSLGDLRVDGGDIGLTADTDLMQISTNKLTLNGELITGNINISGLSDKVGIGTTTPTHELNVVGNSLIGKGKDDFLMLGDSLDSDYGTNTRLNSSRLIFDSQSVYSSANTNNFTIHSNGWDTSLVFGYESNQFANNPNIMVMKYTGEIGIGTSNPTHTLNVVGDANFTGDLIAGDDVYISGGNIYTSTQRITIDQISDTDTHLRIAGQANKEKKIQMMKYDNTGVGFEFWGTNANLINFLAANDYPTRHRTGKYFRFGIDYGGNYAATNSTNSYFLWESGSAEKDLMRLTYDGNLGIGTNTPSQQLVVVGSANISDILYVQNNLTVYDSVGIGTETPTHTLNVVGDVNITGDLIAPDNARSGCYWKNTPSNADTECSDNGEFVAGISRDASGVVDQMLCCKL